MSFSLSKLRVSFQVKVLAPVLAVLVLLTTATIWIVNHRISNQLENEAAAALDKDHAIFTKLQELRQNALLSKYSIITRDARYKSIVQKAEDSSAWYSTADQFLSDQINLNGAVIATWSFKNESAHAFASAAKNPNIDSRLFQARSFASINQAFSGEASVDMVNVGNTLLQVVCIPVQNMDGDVSVVTLGVEIGSEVISEIKQFKGSQILLLADGKVLNSSLPQTELFPGLIDQYNQLSASEGSRADTRQLLLDKKHFIGEAGHFDSKTGAGIGYLMLSSYEESWSVLKATQQMLMLIGILGIASSTCIVWLLIKRVTRPLVQLRDSVEAVGRGDFSQRVAVTSHDECGELATAFNQMTQQVKTSREELEKTVETLKTTQNQLIQSEKLSGIGEFVAGVAHELNNPLTSVMGFSELLQQGELPEQQRRYLDVIFKSAKRCTKIVQSLLSFARRHAPERKVVCVNEIVESAVEILQYQMRTSNIEVTTHLDPRLPATEVDPHQMQQVFLNIINNARQAMEGTQDGKLSVSTVSADNYVRIIFKDNGPGITPENLKRIFNPFFTTKEVGKGTGLGLSLCYGIVSEHGGTIRPSSEPGQGATFTIELPISREAPVPVEKHHPATPAGATQEGVGKSVLVVDDEDMILQMIREALTRNGYKVDVALDGESALRRLSQYHYDLALCDWKMPGLNGEQIYQRLSALNPEMSRRLIFITGDIVNEKTQAFLQQENKVCLSKPFSLGEFHTAIHRVMNSTN